MSMCDMEETVIDNQPTEEGSDTDMSDTLFCLHKNDDSEERDDNTQTNVEYSPRLRSRSKLRKPNRYQSFESEDMTDEDSFSTLHKMKKIEVKAIELCKHTNQKCNLCHRGFPTDVLESGKFYQLSDMAFHYFCLLFAEGGEQNGEDEEGLFGFLVPDVRTLLKESSKINCVYCGKQGSMSKCCSKGCGSFFHFPCGLEAGATFQFVGNMDVFCGKHRVRQNPELLASTPPDYDCVVCPEVVEEEGRVVVPCCKRHFHKNCLQKMAISSGKYHFKCPNCNDKEIFNEEINKLGVYVPIADASWENQESSSFYNFGDMQFRERSCVAHLCLCKHVGGRSHHREGGQFAVVLCKLCGSNGVHKQCGNLDQTQAYPEYECPACNRMENGLQTQEGVCQNQNIHKAGMVKTVADTPRQKDGKIQVVAEILLVGDGKTFPKNGQQVTIHYQMFVEVIDWDNICKKSRKNWGKSKKFILGDRAEKRFPEWLQNEIRKMSINQRRMIKTEPRILTLQYFLIELIDIQNI